MSFKFSSNSLRDYRKRQKEYRKTNKTVFKAPIILSTKVLNEPTYKEQYYSFLNSPFWKEKRLKIIDQKKCCYICNSTNDLNVHHISYVEVYTAKPEKSDCVVLLCRQHHQEFHDKYGVKKVMFRQWHQFVKYKKYERRRNN